jgi:citrate lyase subunit beta / citryl-CoA lyase
MPKDSDDSSEALVRLRSLLFVPGDRPERIEKARASGADAIIIDLEDSVALERKPEARANATRCLRHNQRPVKLLIRINPIGSVAAFDDLLAIAGCKPDGIVLPKTEGAASIRKAEEHLAKRDLQGIPLLPIATETSAAIFHLSEYQAVGAGLLALTWGAEDLPAAIGAAGARNPNGSFTPPYEVVRSLALFAAHAANVPAIETV